MEHPPYTFGRVVAYHGCDLEIGKQLLANKTSLTESENAYDCLGPSHIPGLAPANRVTEGVGGGKQLFLEVSQNYPVNPAGEVDWNEKSSSDASGPQTQPAP